MMFQIINVPDTGFFQELDIGQKRSLVCQELERIKIRTQSKAKIVLSAFQYPRPISMWPADAMQALSKCYYFCYGDI